MLSLVFLSVFFIFDTAAQAQTKSLKLYYLHTGEKATITYKKNGQYLASGLKKINWHLRDWRRNEPTKMDPQLLDLVWEAYRQSGSNAYIHVISGYRSPASNNLLRSRGRGVAKNSQHTLGKALDFFLPDVKLKKMREIGLKMGAGGVGYYPTSGSPFVHFDTGSVRHWPRMSRSELVAVFPKGDTMHVPTDGKPLARYQQAVAEYKRKKASGTLVPKSNAKPAGNLFALFTARNNSDDEEEGADSAPAPRAVTTKAKPAEQKPAEEPAPEPTVEEPQFAEIGGRVPVPTIAPRGAQANGGTEIVIAAAEPAPAPEAEAEASVNGQEAPEPADTAQTDPAINREETAEAALASLAVPVPARRPELATPPAVENGQGVLAGAQPTTELALVDPNQALPSRGTVVAALTPSEIEDLRSRVRSTIGDTNAGARPSLNAPVPAAAIPAANTAQTPAPVPARVPTRSPEPTTLAASSANDGTLSEEAAANTAEITTASLQPAAEQNDPVAPTGIEPGVQSSGKMPVPLPSPLRPATIETAALETDAESPSTEDAPVEPVNAAEEGLTRLALANIPLPARNPIIAESATTQEAPIEIAALEQDGSQADAADIQPANNETASAAEQPQLAKRTISLDRYSAPQNNSTSLGQFALASNITIRELSDVRAPAYGRNVIREVPKTILVQGFNLQPFGPGKNNFQGKAVTAMKFAFQRIN